MSDAAATAPRPASAGASPTGVPVPEPGLDDTMLAMDVVDTLRHADRVVERELQGDDRQARLKQRLREIYATQGIDLPDRILDQGVAALEQHRFLYKPTPPSFSRTLATAWVTRRRWGRPLLFALVALVLAGGGWWFGVHLPAERRAAAEQTELSSTLPRDLQAERDRVFATTTDTDARAQADRLVAQGQAAARAGALADARQNLVGLRTLQRQLALDYTVRIVNRPGEPSGVWRTPQSNARGRNFYLIVEAIDASGKPVAVPVTSEEDGKTVVVSKWAIRVPPEQFEQVRREKLSEGTISNPVVGVKRPGELGVRWNIPVTGGAIVQW